MDPALQQQRMRQQVIEELVTTESDYVRDLKLILSVLSQFVLNHVKGSGTDTPLAFPPPPGILHAA